MNTPTPLMVHTEMNTPTPLMVHRDEHAYPINDTHYTKPPKYLSPFDVHISPPLSPSPPFFLLLFLPLPSSSSPPFLLPLPFLPLTLFEPCSWFSLSVSMHVRSTISTALMLPVCWCVCVHT